MMILAVVVIVYFEFVLINGLCWKLRNPQENFRYATVKDSAVTMYFKRQVELSTMYRTMEGKNYDTPEDAILAVKNEFVFVFSTSVLMKHPLLMSTLVCLSICLSVCLSLSV